MKSMCKINIVDTAIDVTDPCYDADTWCRIRVGPVMPGTYLCYAPVDRDERVKECLIIKKGYVTKSDSWKFRGFIGVDAGLAGFFQNKPDFDDDEWSDFCDKLGHNNWHKSEYNGKECFFTRSGWGDGEYGVYTRSEDGKIYAIKIVF